MKTLDLDATKEALKKARKKKMLSVAEVAEYMSVSGPAVYKWESPNDYTLPLLENFLNLADLYGVKVEDIIKWEAM